MIRIESLSKEYGGPTVVDDVTFTAQPGRVTGFLGPNGAGKSTSMRGREVGVMLDASAQHPGRTGREILTLAPRTIGLPTARVSEMVNRVGLTESAAERRVGTCSLLMGTMLGILFRSSSVALVAYFVTSLLLPTVFGLLATNEQGFEDLQRWVDLNYAQSFLFDGTVSGVQWARLAVATTLWLILPALLGLRLVARSEVK
jgi:ABC-2 type transport system ATP-binding protein